MRLLPAMEADETLYSLCATAHSLGQNRSSARTSMDLFGTLHGPRQHDLPARIGFLGEFGHSNERIQLLREHTIAGYFIPFLNEAVVEASVQNWFMGLTPFARRRFDGSSRTLRPEHPLKWCANCVRDDMEQLGRPYWHVAHQLATSFMCLKHRSALHYISGRNKRWLLPTDSSLPIVSKSMALSGTASQTITELGSMLLQISRVDTKCLRDSAIHRMKSMGVISGKHTARHSRIEKWFASTDTSAFLSSAPPWLASLCKGEWIPPLLWRQKRDHGVYWLLLWSSLSWRNSAEATDSFRMAAEGKTANCNGQFELFENAPHPALAPETIYGALSKASSYAEVMHSLGITRGELTTWLASDIQLRCMWRQRLDRERCQAILKDLEHVVVTDPLVSMAELQLHFAPDIRWLQKRFPAEFAKFSAAVSPRGSRQMSLFNREKMCICGTARSLSGIASR